VTEPRAATEAQAGAFQPALPRAGLPRLQVQLRLVVEPPKRRRKDRTRLLRQTSAPDANRLGASTRSTSQGLKVRWRPASQEILAHRWADREGAA